jgi:hypothetical protein
MKARMTGEELLALRRRARKKAKGYHGEPIGWTERAHFAIEADELLDLSEHFTGALRRALVEASHAWRERAARVGVRLLPRLEKADIAAGRPTARERVDRAMRSIRRG